MTTRNKRSTPKKVVRLPRKFAFQAYVELEENRQAIRTAAQRREMSVSQFLVSCALREAEALNDHTKHTPGDELTA